MLGGENDIIIFATTRSNHSKELGFMIQPELLNVATSRQHMELIIVGDSAKHSLKVVMYQGKCMILFHQKVHWSQHQWQIEFLT